MHPPAFNSIEMAWVAGLGGAGVGAVGAGVGAVGAGVGLAVGLCRVNQSVSLSCQVEEIPMLGLGSVGMTVHETSSAEPSSTHLPPAKTFCCFSSCPRN